MGDAVSRRGLIKAGAALGVGALLGRPAASAGAAHPSLADAGWAEIRRLFRLAAQAPLNAANLCPPLQSVVDVQREYADQLNADVGFLNRRDVVRDAVESSRSRCARMLGLDDEHSLALVPNTTYANAVLVQGLDLGPEDEVLLWDQNHNSNYRAWHYRHRRLPFRVKPVTLPPDPASAAEVVEKFVAALTRKTRLVSFSHLSNISGMRLPAAEICRAVHDFSGDILVHIDGAQSWGSMAVNLDEIGCDSYASSAHKWLCGPRGTGVLMVREHWAERLQPPVLGYDMRFDFPVDKLPGGAARFEALGQRDTAAYAALGQAVEVHEAIGNARVEARVAELTRHALDVFERAGIRTLTPKADGLGHAVVVADLGGAHKSYGAFLALHNAGYAAAFVHGNRVHCSPTGPVDDDEPTYLRIAPHIYNDKADIDTAIELAAKVRDSNFQIIREAIRFL